MLLSVLACSDSKTDDEGIIPDIPLDIDREVKDDMPIQMWVDVDANIDRFKDQANIIAYLQKMKDTGFNEVYLDVKPGIGYALYGSDILPPLKKWGTKEVDLDWDYLQFWIDEAEKLEMEIVACLSVLGFGDASLREGLVYDDPRWDGKTQMRMNNNDPNDIVDVRDLGGSEGAATLNPSITEVQAFVISIIEEIVVKYPNIKGVCLDFCRWLGTDYGFSDATMDAFRAYSGLNVTDRNEIITSTGGIGTFFSEWIEFRSMTITNLISAIRSRVKAANPDAELYLWASAHWSSRYEVGQNWASTDYVPSGAVYTDTYNTTGFAHLLDAFSLGAYASAVWKSEAPDSDWSVENLINIYPQYIMGACKVFGSIGTYEYGNDFTSVSDAVYLCLKNTDGLMVFEISHVINNDQWDAIKDGISRVLK